VGLSDLFAEEPPEQPQNQPADTAQNENTPQVDATPTVPSSTPSPPFNESLTQLQAHLSRVVPMVTRAALQAKKWKQAAQSSLRHATLLPSVASAHTTQSDTPSVRNVFAVVCADSASGLREYPWGSATPRDETVSDLPRLQRLIFEQGSINKLRALTHEFSIRLYHERCRDQGWRDVQTRYKAEERRDWQMKLFLGFVFACMLVMYGVNLAVMEKVYNPTATAVNKTGVQEVPAHPVTHFCAANSAAVTVGMRIEANYHGKGSWRTCRVTAVHGDGTVDVEYDNGTRESFIPDLRIRHN